MAEIENRCRLILIAPDVPDPDELCKILRDALRGGDVASIIFPQYGMDDRNFQASAEKAVLVAQDVGSAAIIANNHRVASRTYADGIHIDGPRDVLAEALEHFQPKLMVGSSRAQDRHQALEIGEMRPDYMFFGKLDGDIKPEAHKKNLALGEWWSDMVEIPCVVMGGSDSATALDIAETGAEFVALRQAVFAKPNEAARIVAEINAVLDEKAPRFEDYS